ncbi:MAG TPA: hypothetical protein VNI57_13410 [Candidatus Saccharimonadales bacterium]|nr:hypothetical protein [Candidatus Saccharimonadales bacterium]
MKPVAKLALGAIAVAATLLPASAGGEASLHFGRRWLEESTWAPVEEPRLAGVSVDFGREAWPVRLEAAYSVSYRREDDTFPRYGNGVIDTRIAELSFGVLKRWRIGGPVGLRLGGGAVSFIEAVDVDGHGPWGRQHDTDTSPGAYAHAGLDFRLGSRVSAGFDVRKVFWTSFTKLEDHYVAYKRMFEGDADYFQVTLLAGWRWPQDG